MDDIETLTKKLFPYAYNILGNIADSQDVIQDVLIKFNEKETSSISNHNAYLIKSVINQAINLKKKNDRERNQRISLPEPIITNQGESKIEIEEILNYSMLVLLEVLNTKERAVFLLKEAFDYDHEEIANILSVSVENSRKLLSRAKKKLKQNKPNVVTTTSRDRIYLGKYIEAIRNRDVITLEQMLSEEVKVLADGGTKVNVVAQLTSGINDTIKLITYVFEHYQKDFRIEIDKINHQPALLFYDDTLLMNCQVFELNKDGKIINIFSVVDPDKLLPN
ncbi:sigma-70 family RNA polymerase sigma factor [Flavobacterium sediminilitoris]|uniref:Sigma-70 family RNA polymerase sigma factor n=1 Tax=Flavobacterium sediminilitoris TaxID=2024526 RepID=A0ABY4HHJ2_9FLAO|nr:MULTISPECIES: sigma-70 family RNA polymerase sigma factor [Flavobacterium]UOX32306.1 sigma-70 family RNA polymerase sigma factor [Flavobacterium sediminilitoris]